MLSQLATINGGRLRKIEKKEPNKIRIYENTWWGFIYLILNLDTLVGLLG
jgi:hypothetical protein